MRYLKVMPVTLPTIAYKLATLTIVSTISDIWPLDHHSALDSFTVHLLGLTDISQLEDEDC